MFAVQALVQSATHSLRVVPRKPCLTSSALVQPQAQEFFITLLHNSDAGDYCSGVKLLSLTFSLCRGIWLRFCCRRCHRLQLFLGLPHSVCTARSCSYLALRALYTLFVASYAAHCTSICCRNFLNLLWRVHSQSFGTRCFIHGKSSATIPVIAGTTLIPAL